MFNLKYVYALVFTSLAAWAVFAYFTTTEIIRSQQEYANIINVTGKQRMLSQKTALFSKRYYEEQDENLKKHLLELYTLMKKDHENIINNHVKSEKTITLYHDGPRPLNLMTSQYFELLSQFLTKPNKPLLRNIQDHSFNLLPYLNSAVSAFEKESDEKTQLLMERELFILFGTLFTLFLEAVFIVIPAIKKASLHESELKSLIRERTAELEKLSVTDQLTKIYNRRYIDTTLSSEIERAKRYGHSFSVVLIDIDFFKKVNDTYGHQAGDHVLQCIAHLLSTNVRKADMVGRWGGEEFLITTTESDSSKVLQFAEKLRHIIEVYEYGTVENITCSLGVTHYIKGDTTTSIVSRADSALYEAKSSGRNCVKEFIGV